MAELLPGYLVVGSDELKSSHTIEKMKARLEMCIRDRLMDVSQLGAITTKGCAAEAWPGNPAPRMAEVPGGMMNSCLLYTSCTESRSAPASAAERAAPRT